MATKCLLAGNVNRRRKGLVDDFFVYLKSSLFVYNKSTILLISKIILLLYSIQLFIRLVIFLINTENQVLSGYSTLLDRKPHSTDQRRISKWWYKLKYKLVRNDHIAFSKSNFW